MMNFLSNGNESVLVDEDFILDAPVGNSHPILRYVAPDKQALTVGELVELLKADHLAQVLEQQDSDEEKKLPETPNWEESSFLKASLMYVKVVYNEVIRVCYTHFYFG